MQVRWVEGLEIVEATHPSAWVWLVDLEGELAAAALGRVRARRADLEDAARWRDPQRGAARLARRLLLRALAARAIGCAASAVEIERDARGRVGVVAPRSMFASVAREGSWAALAVASAPIGVDLAEAEPSSPLPVAVLTPAMRAWVGEGAGAPGRFAHAWTVSEAHAKAVGIGVHEVLAQSTPDRATWGADGFGFPGTSIACRDFRGLRAAVAMQAASSGAATSPDVGRCAEAT